MHASCNTPGWGSLCRGRGGSGAWWTLTRRRGPTRWDPEKLSSDLTTRVEYIAEVTSGRVLNAMIYTVLRNCNCALITFITLCGA